MDNLFHLRKRAEAMLRTHAEQLTAPALQDIETMLHELQVYQIELEMQNDELRRIEQELKASRNKYAHLYDFAPVGYFTLDGDDRILAVNLTGAEMLTLPRQSLLSQLFNRFIHFDDQDVFYFHIRALRETQQPQTCELRLRRRDDTEMYVKLDSIVVQHERDETLQFRVVISDITERKAAERELDQYRHLLEDLVEERTSALVEANKQLQQEITQHKQTAEILHENQHLLRSVVSNAPIILFSIDARGTITLSEGNGLQLVGLEPGQAVGRNIFRLFGRDSQLADNLRRALEGEELSAVSPMPENRVFDIHFTPVRDQYDRVVGVTGVGTDVTDRITAETRLQSYAQRLQNLHEVDRAILAAKSPEAIAQATLTRIQETIPCLHSSIIELTPHMGQARILSLQKEGEFAEGHGQLLMLDDFFTGLCHQTASHNFNDIAELCDQSPMIRQLYQDGGRSLVVVPLLSHGAYIGLLSLVSAERNYFTADNMDMADEIATSIAIAIQQARLYEQSQQDAETKAMLLREVNHRVKNNLAAILGLLYAAQRQIRAQPKHNGPEIMINLISRIEGLAAAHRLLSAAQWAPVPLDELTSQVIHAAMQTLPADKDVAVHVNDSTVQIYPSQANSIALILNELTTNTIKYALNGRRAVHIKVNIAANSDGAQLLFCDDGPGYPDQIAQNISVGMSLIQTLVRRDLRGQVIFRNDNGAIADIWFKPRLD